MLKKRIIPVILIDGFSVIKTINFERRRNLGSPITVMKTFETRNVDEMIILDIDATRQRREFDFWLVRDICDECLMPLTFGGGVTCCNDIERLLKAGADKVSINTSAIADHNFISEAVKTFGSQCIVISIDLQHGLNIRKQSDLQKQDVVLFDHIRKMEDCDVGEFLITDVDAEGGLAGPDLIKAGQLSEMVNKPLIYAGGVSKPDDCADLIEKSGVDAVGCSSIFYFTGFTPNDCRKSLLSRNIPARLT